MKVKEVTRWSNQMKVWLPPKVKAIHLAYISPSLSNWMHWEKVVERENASWTLASSLTFALSICFTFTIYLTFHFTFALYCSTHVILIPIYTLSLHSLGIYFHCKLWLFHKYNSTLDFCTHLLLILWKKSCHMGLTFTLALPPRMGAFPPCFPL